MGIFYFDNKLRRDSIHKVKRDDINSYLLIISYFGMVVFFLYVSYYAGFDVTSNIWNEREDNYFSFLMPVLSYTGFIIFALLTTIESRIIKIMSLPILLLIFASTGARVIFTVLLGAFWFFCIRKLTRKQIVVFGSIGFVVFAAIHVVSRTLRSVGLGAFLSGNWHYISEDISNTADLTGGDGSIGEGYVLAMQAFNTDAISSIPFATLIRLALLPFPSTVFSFKPDDITYELWRYGIRSGYFDQDIYFRALVESYSLGQNGSLHPTIWGDALLNAGWFGCILWPILLAFVFVAIERFIARRGATFMSMFLAAVAAPSLIYIVRGNVFVGVILLLTPMIFASLLMWLSRLLFRASGTVSAVPQSSQ